VPSRPGRAGAADRRWSASWPTCSAACRRSRGRCSSTSPVDIVEVALTAVETVRHLATQKDQHLHVRVPDRPVPPVIADRARVHQVVSNLLGNAARYTPDGGHITVDVVSEGDAIDIVVTDTGCGIPSHGLATLFQPFTRGGRPPGDGGLGLWLARELLSSTAAALRHAARGPVAVRHSGFAFRAGAPPACLIRRVPDPRVARLPPTARAHAVDDPGLWYQQKPMFLVRKIRALRHTGS
jgi:hypothetical protein